mgnify:CR=1 FL=1
MADVTNYTIENNSGANVRIDLNNVFAAIQSSNSKSTDLAASQCVAGMPFLNTTTNILKIRNSSNNGFTDLGNIDQANLGLLSKSGGTMSGPLLIDNSNSVSTPALSFEGDTDLGLYRRSANIMGFSAGGVEQMHFDANGITLRLQNEMRFSDNDNSHYVAIKPGTVSANRTLTLPNATGTIALVESSSITIGSSSGTYTKVGRMVLVEYLVQWTAISGSGSYNVGCSGLPFAAEGTQTVVCGCGRSNSSGRTFVAESVQNNEINVFRQ